MTHEMLQTLWFILIAVLWIGFYFLEGFDFGVGMLLTFLGKKDEERRAIINTIGPTWDGNEVWLIAAGGAMFAAFPMWYATMFSGFYLALFLLLVGLIIRGIAFEYRSKDSAPRWRHTFDWMITIGSFMCALLLGVAFANLAKGVPIDADHEHRQPEWNRDSPVLAQSLWHSWADLQPSQSSSSTAQTSCPSSWRVICASVPEPLRGECGLQRWWRSFCLPRRPTYYTDVLTKLGVNPGITPILAVGGSPGNRFFHSRQTGRLGVHHDLPANRADHGHFLPAHVPAGDDLQPQPGLVADHLQRLFLPVHLDDHEHHRADLRPDHSRLPGLDLLDVPQAYLHR